MSKELDIIDAVLSKPREEWSDEELDMIIDWKVQARLADEEHQIQYAAIQETMLETAEANMNIAESTEAVLQEMKAKAFELLERAGV